MPTYARGRLESARFLCGALPAYSAESNCVLQYFRTFFESSWLRNGINCEFCTELLLLLLSLILLQDSLRKRFSKSLQWFCALRDAARNHVDDFIVSSSTCHTADNRKRRGHVINMGDGPLHSVERDNSPSEASSSQMESEEPGPESESTPESHRRPSPYLQRRCPLCFGGRSWAHDPNST